VNLQELLETRFRVCRLAAEILTTVAVFAGRPEPGTKLMQACLPAILSHVADTGGTLRDVANILQDPARLVGVLEVADWPIDNAMLETLEQGESGPLLRRWSAIFGSLSENFTINEELERRTAQATSTGRNEDEGDG